MLGRLLVLACLAALAGCGSWAPRPGHGHAINTVTSPANSVPQSRNSLPSGFDYNTR